MNTLFIVAERNVDAHTGEEYDYILEVEDQPTTETIQEIADRIRTRIRSMWMEQTAPKEGTPIDNPQVVCTVDAASPFTAMLIDLQLILKDEEGIEIDLPGIEASPEPTDPEARRVLGYDKPEGE
jgi:hypothetical protein